VDPRRNSEKLGVTPARIFRCLRVAAGRWPYTLWLAVPTETLDASSTAPSLCRASCRRPRLLESAKLILAADRPWVYPGFATMPREKTAPANPAERFAYALTATTWIASDRRLARGLAPGLDRKMDLDWMGQNPKLADRQKRLGFFVVTLAFTTKSFKSADSRGAGSCGDTWCS